MAETTRKIDLPYSPGAVWEWLTRPGAAARLFPPGGFLSLPASAPIVPTPLEEGTGLTLFRQGPWGSKPQRLRVRTEGNTRLVLEGIGAPAQGGTNQGWRLVYNLSASSEGCTLETTLVGVRGLAKGARLLEQQQAMLAADLERHRPYGARKPLRVLVSGATGLVGRRLCPFLAVGGHTMLRLARETSAGPAENLITWNPAQGTIDKARLEGLDAVIHLAGANLADGRWNPARKESIRASRVEGTALLSRTLAGLSRPPRVLLSASAVGVYGDTGDTLADEDSPPGKGFLADVCRDWEAALNPAEDAGIRVVRLRLGMVLAREGGALAKMITPFRMGLGGPLGSGKQFLSWIALEDLLGVMLCALQEEGWRGPINAVAPLALTQRDFARTLGQVLKRPAFAPLPAFVVRTLFGEMGQALLLEGQRTRPTRLEAAGFQWATPRLEQALCAELS